MKKFILASVVFAIAFTMKASAQLSASMSIVPVACKGNNTGVINLVVSGQTGLTYFLWNDGTTNANRTNLYAGTYSVTVTDDLGSVNLTGTVTEPAIGLVATNVLVDQASCGLPNGKMTVLVSNSSNYIYAWQTTPVQTTATGTGLAYGINSYCVITDTLTGCSITDTVIVPTRNGFTALLQTSNVSCSGGNNGSINSIVQNTTGPFTYLWNNGQTTQNISNLSIGTYSVTISNLGCTGQFATTLGQPSVLGVTTIATKTICGGNTGSATSNPFGGTTPYSYSWNTIPVKTTAVATGLASGIYVVTVTDANGCTKTATASIGCISLSGTVQNVLCNGFASGKITLTVSGGTGVYYYLWSNGSTVKNQMAVKAGTYTVTVTNSGSVLNYIGTVTQPPVLIASVTSFQNVSTPGGNDGSITATGSGGTPPYSYLWGGGQTTATITGLIAGAYSGKVTDANGCIKYAYIILTQPSARMMNTAITDEDIMIYPNPSNGTISFTENKTNSDLSVVITTESGQIVFDKILKADENLQDLKLANGVYFVLFKSHEKNWTNKLIVQ